MTDLAPLLPLARALIARCTEKRLTIATAESCTGGLVAGVLTEIAGSSAVVDRGMVTYSNAAKSALLGVLPEVINRNGAVSETVARAMAEGALARSTASLVVAITGIAGPGGGSDEKPVGLVHFAAARRGGGFHHVRCLFPDEGRSAIRLAAVRQALTMLRELAG
jgi:nicotinamide-nucleotide amidase